MSKIAEHPLTSPAQLERRRQPRKKILEMSYFDFLDGENGGLVLNLSESGLSLQFALRANKGEVCHLRFRLPASDPWIEARARLVWVGESGREAGAQFLELSEEASARIKEWLAKGSVPPSPAGISAKRTVSRQAIEESLPAACASARGAALDANIRSEFSHQLASVSPSINSLPTSGAGQRRPGTATEVTTPRSVQENRDRPSSSFVRPRRDTSFPLWGLSRVVFFLAVAGGAAFLGLRYSGQIPQLPILGRWNHAWNGARNTAKAADSESGKHEKLSAGPTQAQPRGLAASLPAPGAAPASTAGARSNPAPFVRRNTEPAFAGMLTETLPSGSPDAGSPATARVRSYPHSGLHSWSGVPTANDKARQPSRDVLLVGAPPVGAPSVRVILESEPVSASSHVAVTATRSLLVPGSYDPTEELQLGKLVSFVNPVYPVGALERGIEGTVTIRAFIGPSGSVLSLRLLSGPRVLALAAMNAIREWRFDRTLLNGQAIESQADISVFFRLH